MPEWIHYLPEATAPAWWGAILSTFLAFIKVWELWQDRFRIEFFLNCTSSTDDGNEIHIRNLSPHQIIISNWDVIYRSGLWPFRKEEIVSGRHYLDDDIVISPLSPHIIHCSEPDYSFSTNPKLLRGRKIFLRLRIAGHREICRKIYS